MQIKRGVKLRNLQPQMVFAAIIAHQVLEEEFKRELVITSGSEGKHSKNSLHYCGYAIDIRSNHLGDIFTDEVVKKLQEQLADEYDVVKSTNCIHIEYQPETE